VSGASVPDIESVLAEHQRRGVKCECGLFWPGPSWNFPLRSEEVYAWHRTHVAAVLADRETTLLAAAGVEAIESAADNMPLNRPGQPWEPAADWLRRRAAAIARAANPEQRSGDG
jgi:hypothetical protein